MVLLPIKKCIFANRKSEMRKFLLAILLLFASASALVAQDDTERDSLLVQMLHAIDVGNMRIETLVQDSIRLSARISMIEAQTRQCIRMNDSLVGVIAGDSVSMSENRAVIDSLEDSLYRLSDKVGRLRANNNYLRGLRDSLILQNNNIQTELREKNELLNSTITALKEKEKLFVEKEQLYKDAIANSNVDKVKLQGEINAKNMSIDAKAVEIDYLQRNINEKERILDAQQQNYAKLSLEKEHYFNLADSLRTRLVEAEKTILKKEEQLKYTEQRAKDAETKIAAATSRKKKVSAVQGIAMRTFRTPNWVLSPAINDEGSTVYKITNRNAGKIEFDYITGAYVMLWNLSHTPDDTKFRRFDQDFSYSLGLYVGFGGSNLFKNFYVGPTFKFLDFFHLSVGVNICEYEILNDGVSEGDVLQAGWSISDQTRKAWMAKPFFSLSFDLDFISYIKR